MNQHKAEKNYIRQLKDISIKDVHLVGRKSAWLGEMHAALAPQGMRAPNGFSITADLYAALLASHGLKKKIKALLKETESGRAKDLARIAKKIRNMLMAAPLDKEMSRQIVQAYRTLSKEKKIENFSVAVGSSIAADGLPDEQFLGQHEIHLNVVGEKALLHAVGRCMASLFAEKAFAYRQARGLDHLSLSVSVSVHEMVGADTGASGALLTFDPESGFRGVTILTAAYGLGLADSGEKNSSSDRFLIFKEGMRKGKKAIIGRTLGEKKIKRVCAETRGTADASVSKKDRNTFAVSDEDLLRLAIMADAVEKHFQSPQRIAWAKDGQTGELFFVAARSEIIPAHGADAVMATYRLNKIGKELAQGIAVGKKIGAGKVRKIDKESDKKLVQKGDILVAPRTGPDWEPLIRMAAAVVTEEGGKTGHAAIIARELGIPCIVGARGILNTLKNGHAITVSCADGERGIIYDGILPFEVKNAEFQEIPETKTKIMMNTGDPEHAFSLSFLPHDGAGLARQEFIFSHFIRIHPLALLHYDTLKDMAAKKRIQKITRGYAKKADYCVDKLAEGVGRIAAAMYPRPVFLRLSDFKTNEYAALIGGKEFEPKEDHPLFGWRGASRYASKAYKKAFGLECRAIKRAREEWGLDNIVVVVPFCRTPEEGEEVLRIMKEFGLQRGENGLQVHVMCEIPSNVILAKEFAAIFDGFSIGSNDLVQMTLGIDRDLPNAGNAYNENDPSVKKLIREVIRVAHAEHKTVSICGQAPSDSPEFTDFLVQAGIDGISLNPDALLETRERVAYAEKTVGRSGAKTHPHFLGLVALLGLLGSAAIGLGAGCSDIATQLTGPRSADFTVSPAAIRQKVEEKFLALQAKKEDNALSTLTVKDFASFSIQYPTKWSVEQWNGGVTMQNKETGEYVSLFRQVVGHPVPADQKQQIMIGGKEAMRYRIGTDEDIASQVHIIEIPMDDNSILEINGKTERFQTLLDTFYFLSEDSFITDRDLNHWDIKEGRICAQMITYARSNKTAACQAFSTPCDVPEYWEVCDAEI